MATVVLTSAVVTCVGVAGRPLEAGELVEPTPVPAGERPVDEGVTAPRPDAGVSADLPATIDQADGLDPPSRGGFSPAAGASAGNEGVPPPIPGVGRLHIDAFDSAGEVEYGGRTDATAPGRRTVPPAYPRRVPAPQPLAIFIWSVLGIFVTLGIAQHRRARSLRLRKPWNPESRESILGIIEQGRSTSGDDEWREIDSPW